MDWIPWDKIFGYAAEYDVDPFLIGAIGWHETQWGVLGAGRQGYHTGYGATDSGLLNQYAGLDNQIKYTTIKMGRWGMNPGEVTLEGLILGNSGGLPSGIYASDPGWPAKVFKYYQDFVNQFGAGTPPTSYTPIGGDTQMSGWDMVKESLGRLSFQNPNKTAQEAGELNQGLGFATPPAGVDWLSVGVGVSYVVLVVVLVVVVLTMFKGGK